MPKVPVYDYAQNAVVQVEASEAQSGISSGKYGSTPDTLLRQETGGGDVRRELDDAPFVEASGGQWGDGSEQFAEEQGRLQEEALSGWDDKASVFAEGIIDAASLGLIRGQSDVDIARREANPGSAIAGNIVGTVGSMGVGGPVKSLTKGGEAFGKALAKSALKGAEGRVARAATKAAEEAAAGAVITTIMATNHQLTDALIKDKPFSAEAIAAEVGVGTILSGGLGAVGGALSRGVNRSALKGKGGLLDISSDESKQLISKISESTQQAASVLDNHAGKYGILEQIDKQHPGLVSRHWQGSRKDALDMAQRAYNKLKQFDVNDALSGSDNKKYIAWQNAYDDFSESLDKLEDVMRARKSESLADLPEAEHPSIRGSTPRKLNDPKFRAPDQEYFGAPEVEEPGVMRVEGQGLDVRMASDEAAQARYKEIYGKDWEPVYPPEHFEGNVPEPQVKVDGEAQRAGTAVGKKQRPVSAARSAMDDGAAFREVAQNPDYSPPPGLIADELDARFDARRMELDNALEDQAITPEQHEAGFQEIAQELSELRQRQGRAERGKLAKNPSPDSRSTANYKAPSELEVLQQRLRSGEIDEAQFDAEWDKLDGGETVPESAPGPSVSQGWDIEPGQDGAARFGKDAPQPQWQGPKNRPTEIMPVDRAEPAPRIEERTIEPGVKDWINQWYNESNQAGPVQRQGDVYASQLKMLLDEMSANHGKQLDAVGGLNPQELLGLPRSRSSMGERMQQLFALRQLGNAVADGARGVKPPKGVMDKAGRMFQNYAAGKLGAKLMSAVVGGAMGGPLGFILGAQLSGAAAKTVGGIASTAGKVASAVGEAVSKSLSGGKSAAVGAAVANKPHAYDKDGPIADPLERIEKIQMLASRPDALKITLMEQLGDLPNISPEVAQALVDQQANRIQMIAMRAPAFVWDAMGRKMMPGQSKMRQFLEYENAANNLQPILDNMARGTLTRCQSDALRECWPQAHMQAARDMLNMKDKYGKLSPEKRRQVELVVGGPLFRNPQEIMRHQMNWLTANEAEQQAQAQMTGPGSSVAGIKPQNGVNGAPQAFNIGQSSKTNSATPGQSSMAPGNM